MYVNITDTVESVGKEWDVWDNQQQYDSVYVQCSGAVCIPLKINFLKRHVF
jgi:hypothetical protein